MSNMRFGHILRSDVDPNRHYVGITAISMSVPAGRADSR
jgi:hypothetical protein